MPIHTIQLKYTASNIAKAETEANRNFMAITESITTSSVPSVSDLKFLFNAGGGSDDDFDKAFSEGVDNVVLIIMRGISDSGFLGVKLNIRAMEQELMAKKAEAQKALEAMETSGEANKA